MKKKFIYFVFFVSGCFLSVSCKDDNKTDIGGVKEPDLETQLNGKFTNEIIPLATLTCFQGAYYRKAVSSRDFWLGIEGTVVLPTPHYDPQRAHPTKPQQFLDNASVYIGGQSGGQETDIGLTWEVIRDENGNVTPDRRAFRPFLRRTGYTATGQAALYRNAPAESRYYWYPGETVTLSVQMVEAGKLVFKVSGADKSYEEIFDVDGYQYANKAEYKRVNAIDQVSNEGKPVQATNTKVLGAKWLSVFLFRNYQSEVVKAPMHTSRFTDMRCPKTSHFDVQNSAKPSSEETIDIYGSETH